MRARPTRRALLAASAGLASLAALPTQLRAAGEPLRIGVIAELSTLPGAAIPKGAQMAADAINASVGVMGRPIQLIVYDDHVSAADAVKAFQRLASQDNVVAIIASFISEVALALEPWSARLKMPFLTSAASNDIAKAVHDDYDRFKYTFQPWFTSYLIAESTCDSARDLLAGQLHMKSAVIMGEDAAWTTPLDAAYLELLPKAGLEVRDHIRFSPDTSDFTPIFNRIEARKPDVIITGISHVGVVPTVQWSEQKVPVPMYGVSTQATSADFWKDTHGAAAGASSQTCAGPDSRITAKTLPSTEAYQQRYGVVPAFCGYLAHDMVHLVAEAIARAGTTNADKLVTALEASDHLGTIGRIQFYGRAERFTHAARYGADFVPSVMIQWQNARMTTIWPLKYATEKIAYPAFVRLPA